MLAILITSLVVVVAAACYYLWLWFQADKRRDRAEKAINAQVNGPQWHRERNPQARTPHRRDLKRDTQTPAGPLPPLAVRTGGAALQSSHLVPARADSTEPGNVPACAAGGAGTLPPPRRALPNGALSESAVQPAYYPTASGASTHGTALRQAS